MANASDGPPPTAPGPTKSERAEIPTMDKDATDMDAKTAALALQLD